MQRSLDGADSPLTCGMHPDVEIVAHGPAGVVRYREGTQVGTFDWEFGTGDVVISIYVPAPADWDAKLPWAAGRRTDILETLAREVRRQQCWGCGIEITERWINLTERSLPRILGDALRWLIGRRTSKDR